MHNNLLLILVLIYQNKKDLLVTSQTGSGKTIAYFLSIQDEISLKKVKEKSSPSV